MRERLTGSAVAVAGAMLALGSLATPALAKGGGGDGNFTATGVRVVEMTLYHGGTSHMAAHAVDQRTGEVIDGSVDSTSSPADVTRRT
jgi:hypothetical protein